MNQAKSKSFRCNSDLINFTFKKDYLQCIESNTIIGIWTLYGRQCYLNEYKCVKLNEDGNFRRSLRPRTKLFEALQT